MSQSLAAAYQINVMHRFYAASGKITGSEVILDLDETRHLRDVLRLKMGDRVHVFDGEGKEYRCSIRAIEKKTSHLAVVDEVEPASRESSLGLSLAAAVLKSDKTDLVVQKAVELGVTSFTPLTTIRTDVKVKTGDKRVERWRRIALEATKQCGRARLMTVADPVTFDVYIAGLHKADAIIFSERDGEPFSTIKGDKSITAILGPEGGWDDAELDLARSHNCRVITFGGRVLRAETAAISITAILQHRFGDVN